MKAFVWLGVVLWALCIVSCGSDEENLQTDFSFELKGDNVSEPFQLIVTNESHGADFYHWTFEGGSPDKSTKKQPGPVTFSKPGTYHIKLEAWNTSKRGVKEIEIEF